MTEHLAKALQLFDRQLNKDIYHVGCWYRAATKPGQELGDGLVFDLSPGPLFAAYRSDWTSLKFFSFIQDALNAAGVEGPTMSAVVDRDFLPKVVEERRDPVYAMLAAKGFDLVEFLRRAHARFGALSE